MPDQPNAEHNQQSEPKERGSKPEKPQTIASTQSLAERVQQLGRTMAVEANITSHLPGAEMDEILRITT